MTYTVPIPAPAGPADACGIEVTAVQKAYGPHQVLDGLDLTVGAGTVYALLGPNGAGKTTLTRIVSTLTPPDVGSVRVAGHDVVTDPVAVRRAISLTGQSAAVDELLTGAENLRMLGRLVGLGSTAARARAAELLSAFALDDAADRRVGTWSGGMKRRLDLALSLVGEPRVLLLDEPTTGLDPRSRQELWRMIGRLRSTGTTILLTTQYLEEADALANSIAVVDHGRIIARGSADQLKAQIGGERIEVVVRDPRHISAAAEILTRNGDGDHSIDQHTRRVTAAAQGGAQRLAQVLRALDEAGIEIDDIGLRRPTLDDVFLTLTGRAAEPSDDVEGESDESVRRVA